MPAVFAGAAIGVASLFWLMGALVAAGATQARRIRAVAPA